MKPHLTKEEQEKADLERFYAHLRRVMSDPSGQVLIQWLFSQFNVGNRPNHFHNDPLDLVRELTHHACGMSIYETLVKASPEQANAILTKIQKERE